MAIECKYRAPTRASGSFRLGAQGYKMTAASCDENLAAASSLSLAPVAASLPPTQVVPMAMAAAATEEGGISAAPAMASVAAMQ